MTTGHAMNVAKNTFENLFTFMNRIQNICYVFFSGYKRNRMDFANDWISPDKKISIQIFKGKRTFVIRMTTYVKY